MRQDKLIAPPQIGLLIAKTDDLLFYSHRFPAVRKLCFAFFSAVALLFFTSANAANWYVRPSSAGSNNGTDWNNAWSLSGINWASVNAGDTVWLAGGAYSSGISFTKSGSAGNPISVRRVLSTDSIPALAAGWSSSYDSQVVMTPSGGNVLNYSANYITIDGRIWQGIKLNVPNAGSCNGALMSGHNNIVLANLEMAGPGPTATISGTMSAWGANGGSSIQTTNCDMHGCLQVVTMVNCTACTFDHCDLHDSGCANSSTYHPNMAEYNASSGAIFRYCTFRSWPVEGFMFWNGSGALTIYGCVIRDPSSGAPSFLWPSGSGESSAGPIYLYNNTFVNVPIVTGQGNQINAASGSQTRNNIYWNSSWSVQIISDMDYDFSSGSATGSHSISSGSNPFVNLSGSVYQIISTVGAKYPKDKGVALAAPYNIDPNGVVRGSDGAWDIGAYEYGSVSTNSTPAPIVSAISQSGSDVDPVAAGIQIYSGSVVQYSGSASDPSGLPLTWQWIYTVNGGSEVVFQSGTGSVPSISYNYTTSTAGSTYIWKLRVSNGTSSTESDLTVGVEAPPLPSGTLTFQASSGVISLPFVLTSIIGSLTGAAYISQPLETGLVGAGQAVYNFTITNAGTYVVQVMVNAASASANSLYVNIDAQPQDPANIWDIPVTSGFQQMLVSGRGNGTFDNDQYVPQTFTLAVGAHRLIIVGREANVQLESFSILQLPPPPQGLHIVGP